MAMTADVAPAYQVQVEDVAYRQDGAKPLMATLYLPQGAGPFSGLVEVHGGAWTSKDRFNNAATAKAVAAAGVVVMSIEFRMPPEAPYPASLQDINFAIRWLKFHARDYKSAADRVGVYGTSSGGNQALLAALRPTDPRYAALPFPEAPNLDAKVAYVATGWAVMDPVQRYHLAQQRGAEGLIKAHHAFWGDERMMSDGDPPLILARGEKVDMPPAFLFQGTADQWTPTPTVENFVKLYRERGGKVELKLFEGEPHAFVNDHPERPASAEAIAMLAAFCHRFAGSGPS
ncbi:MAG TPA: alpha/beta hydrolase [Stellaceae bacterium]|nr:alpha/beta hydrolase [Stellaceae bacterium]